MFTIFRKTELEKLKEEIRLERDKSHKLSRLVADKDVEIRDLRAKIEKLESELTSSKDVNGYYFLRENKNEISKVIDICKSTTVPMQSNGAHHQHDEYKPSITSYSSYKTLVGYLVILADGSHHYFDINKIEVEKYSDLK